MSENRIDETINNHPTTRFQMPFNNINQHRTEATEIIVINTQNIEHTYSVLVRDVSLILRVQTFEIVSFITSEFM